VVGDVRYDIEGFRIHSTGSIDIGFRKTGAVGSRDVLTL
jgi:hypothetical protein